MSMEALAECRKRIDVLDIQILGLLNERTRVVEEIGRIKQTLSLPIYEPKREDEVFVFVNPTLEFPQKISYRRATEGWLYASLDGKVKGVERQVIYPMRRINCESGEMLLR